MIFIFSILIIALFIIVFRLAYMTATFIRLSETRENYQHKTLQIMQDTICKHEEEISKIKSNIFQ